MIYFVLVSCKRPLYDMCHNTQCIIYDDWISKNNREWFNMNRSTQKVWVNTWVWCNYFRANFEPKYIYTSCYDLYNVRFFFKILLEDTFLFYILRGCMFFFNVRNIYWKVGFCRKIGWSKVSFFCGKSTTQKYVFVCVSRLLEGTFFFSCNSF